MKIEGGVPLMVTFDSRDEMSEFYLNTGIVGGLPVVREIREAIDAATLQTPGQGVLFEEPIVDAPDVPIGKIWPVNLVDWALGQEAGYRGDELIEQKSHDFMLGYHQGEVSKAAYEAVRGKTIIADSQPMTPGEKK